MKVVYNYLVCFLFFFLEGEEDFKISDSLWWVCWIRPTGQVNSQPSSRRSVMMRTVMIMRPLIVHDDDADDSIGRCPNSSVCYCCYCWVIDDGYCCCYFAICSILRPIYYYSHSNRQLVYLNKKKMKKKKWEEND